MSCEKARKVDSLAKLFQATSRTISQQNYRTT